jgi:hypothetical protein
LPSVISRKDKNILVFLNIGETGDYSTRGYDTHHKRQCIEKHGSNEFEIHVMNVTDKQRLEIEGNLINTNNPPCND